MVVFPFVCPALHCCLADLMQLGFAQVLMKRNLINRAYNTLLNAFYFDQYSRHYGAVMIAVTGFTIFEYLNLP